jgi:hypothetical protein
MEEVDACSKFYMLGMYFLYKLFMYSPVPFNPCPAYHTA